MMERKQTVAFLLLSLFTSFTLTFSEPDSQVVQLSDATFAHFLRGGHARLLALTFKGKVKKSFQKHYELAALLLKPFSIQLGQLDCDLHPDFPLCARPHADLFLFGFRGSLKEKLALPINTLEDENSIIASALHLELVQKVAIIQTASELEALYKKCEKKCDVILSFHNNLGTKEHRLFLSLAWRLQSKGRVFALSTAGSASPLKKDLDTNSVHLWLVQCKSHACALSTFNANFERENVQKFIASLHQPLLQVKSDFSEENSSEYAELVFVFEQDAEKRVSNLAQSLAVTFRGSLLVTLAPIEFFSNTLLYNATSAEIAPPTLLFLPNVKSEKVAIHNGLEDINTFVQDQILHLENLKASLQNHNKAESFGRAKKHRTELKIEDMSPSSKDENLFCPSEKMKSRMHITLFFLQWDSASGEMSKVLKEAEAKLGAAVARINCYTDRDDCLHVHTFPSLQFTDGKKSAFISGLISFKTLIQTTRRFEIPVAEFEETESLLQELDDPRFEIAESAVGLVVDLDGILKSSDLEQRDFGIELIFAHHNAAIYLGKKLKCRTRLCFGIQKFADPLEPIATFPGEFRPEGSTELDLFVQSHKFPLFPELSVDNFSRLKEGLLLISLGVQETVAIADCAKRAITPVTFSYVRRDADWFERVRTTHLPPLAQSGLIALNLSQGVSFHFEGNMQSKLQIDDWIANILAQKINPSVILEEKKWKPEGAAVDYLALSEKVAKSEQNQETEDFFVASHSHFTLE